VKVDIQEINSYTRELTFDVPWDEMVSDFDTAVRKFGKKIQLPGFRPGKIPRRVLLSQFRPNIEAEFIETMFPEYFAQGLKENGLVPLNHGEISDLDFQYQSHFSFRIQVEVEPEIKLPPLRRNSLKVQKTVFITDEQDVERVIQELREQHAEMHTVEDGARVGHYILADFQRVDESGLPIVGEKLEKGYIKVGEGVFAGENERRLVGLKPGDKARLMIPKKDSEEKLPVEITVINVEEYRLPEVDQDFIRTVDPTAPDEATWRQHLRERLDRMYAERSEEALNRQLADAMIALVDPEYPPSMVDTYLNYLVEKAEKAGGDKKVDDTYIRETHRAEAIRNLKWYLIRKAIIREQQLEVNREEIDREIQRLKEQSPDQALEIDKYYRKPSHRERLADDLMEQKIMDYLRNFAKIKEVKVKTRDLREESPKEV
jgi:trigger factor